jgi:hypothetical protein
MRHPARFRSLGFDSRHERPPAARPLTGALCPPPKGAHVEGARAGASNGAPVRDHEIRASLLATLERQFAGDPETLIVPEMDVHRGASGVDVAVVNGALRDYEIKRERDTLDRLLVRRPRPTAGSSTRRTFPLAQRLYFLYSPCAHAARAHDAGKPSATRRCWKRKRADARTRTGDPFIYAC